MSSLEELRRENTELRTKLAQLERVVSVVEAASEAILSTATDGTILSWNRAAERLYGFTVGEAVGRSVLELVPFDRLREHKESVERALRGEAVMLDTRRRRRDGRAIEVTILHVGLVDDSRPIGVALISHAR